MDARREQLDAGDVEAVIASMRRLRPSHAKVQDEVRTAAKARIEHAFGVSLEIIHGPQI